MKRILFVAATLMISASAFAQVPRNDQSTINNQRLKVLSPEARYKSEQLKQLQEVRSKLTPQQRKAQKAEFQYRRQQIKGHSGLKHHSGAKHHALKKMKGRKHHLKHAGHAKFQNLSPQQRARLREHQKENR